MEHGPISALIDLLESTTGDDLPPGREEARGDAGDQRRPGSGGRRGAGGRRGIGSQAGYGSAPFALHVIDWVNAPDERPTWWDYSGRWGVEVSGADGSWQSGTQRIDQLGRSLGYFNAYWLEDHAARA